MYPYIRKTKIFIFIHMRYNQSSLAKTILRWPGYPGIYFLDFTHNLTIFYCIVKLIFVIVLGCSVLAFDANHFPETCHALFKIKVKNGITITFAA
jgi:hypothetical protein